MQLENVGDKPYNTSDIRKYKQPKFLSNSNNLDTQQYLVSLLGSK